MSGALVARGARTATLELPGALAAPHGSNLYACNLYTELVSLSDPNDSIRIVVGEGARIVSAMVPHSASQSRAKNRSASVDEPTSAHSREARATSPPAADVEVLWKTCTTAAAPTRSLPTHIAASNGAVALAAAAFTRP